MALPAPLRNLRTYITRHPLWRTRSLLWPLAGALLVLAVHVVVIVIFGPRGAVPTALHYNVYLGVDIVAEPSQLYILPGIGAVAMLINLLALFWLGQRERFLSHWLAIGTVFVQVLLLTATSLIIGVL